jgi:hypothetical protein
MPKGFMYLFVIIDWYSRYIVDYELSSSLDKSFVLVCLKRALSKYKPEIINSDQGGHFTNRTIVIWSKVTASKSVWMAKANVWIMLEQKGSSEHSNMIGSTPMRSIRLESYERSLTVISSTIIMSGHILQSMSMYRHNSSIRILHS